MHSASCTALQVAADFKTQARALFRKNVVFQRRNAKSNCCLLSAPIAFCVLLFLIQTIVNRVLLNSDDLKVGAETAGIPPVDSVMQLHCTLQSTAGFSTRIAVTRLHVSCTQLITSS